jgi:UDPglucose--hexose-1-phosphate uridylyltransferase
LTQDYILVSPHRTKRPWKGQVEAPVPPSTIQYDPECYLCPRNTRAGGAENPDYENTFVFTNDYSAVLPAPVPEAGPPKHPLLRAETVSGGCDVIAFHKRHDLTLARLSAKEIEPIIDEWIKIYKTRGSQPDVKYIQIFEVRYTICAEIFITVLTGLSEQG